MTPEVRAAVERMGRLGAQANESTVFHVIDRDPLTGVRMYGIDDETRGLILDAMTDAPLLAREVERLSGEVERLRRERDEAESREAVLADILNSWAREEGGIEQATRPADAGRVADALWSKTSTRLARLTARLAKAEDVSAAARDYLGVKWEVGVPSVFHGSLAHRLWDALAAYDAAQPDEPPGARCSICGDEIIQPACGRCRPPSPRATRGSHRSSRTARSRRRHDVASCPRRRADATDEGR